MWVKLKQLKPSLVIGIIFSLMCLYFLGHIIYWYFNGTYTNDLLNGINDYEVVGVEVEPSSPTDVTKPKEKKFPFVPVDFTDLKKRNPDTVAWLKVDAVNINIPIVQTTNNDYYLSHDINKKPNNLGWVFADARCNMEFLGTNTVLYGHNAANKEMFGSLKDLFKVDPEMKDQNEIIQLTTPTKQMVFEIASVYVTDYDDWKYVKVNFSNDEEKREFIKRMREKNKMKIFDRPDLSVHDKFLTFSTCYGPAGTTKRLVVHARLVAEQDN